MKFIFVQSVLVLIIDLRMCISERRIINGQTLDPSTPKRYMAYLLKAEVSPKEYDAWICGGAIVTPDFIVTSAACVEDIVYMYAITGYNKYVPAKEINKDRCTKISKKKVVFSCTPKSYELRYDKTEKWSLVDIAAVRVESPFDFTRKEPLPDCSWVPDMIEINFEPKYQEPGTDSMVLGWGHTEKWRKETDYQDYNQKELRYASTLIQDKQECIYSYNKTPELGPVIQKYMICTNEAGNIGANGRLIVRTPPEADGCNPKLRECAEYYRKRNNTYPYGPYANYNNYWRRKGDTNDTYMYNFTRRYGICQNDHGGPLVTWVGTAEVLIGVASVFLVSGTDMKCVGPYLYTSTQCNGAFLGCVLDKFADKNISRVMDATQDGMRREDIFRRYQHTGMYFREVCDMAVPQRGFDMVQRRISWVNHPDGPAQNELDEDLIPRAQVPLNEYHRLDEQSNL